MSEGATITVEQAIRLLHPETTGEAIAEIEYYNGFSGRTAAVHAISHACELACEIMREYEKVKRERDAAVEDMRGRCYSCAHARPHEKYPNMNGCKYISVAVSGYGKTLCEHWEWRGPKEE